MLLKNILIYLGYTFFLISNKFFQPKYSKCSNLKLIQLIYINIFFPHHLHSWKVIRILTRTLINSKVNGVITFWKFLSLSRCYDLFFLLCRRILDVTICTGENTGEKKNRDTNNYWRFSKTINTLAVHNNVINLYCSMLSTY